jgi:hypothetical protein
MYGIQHCIALDYINWQLFFSFSFPFLLFFLTGEDIVLKCLGFNSRLFVDQKLHICFKYS